VHVTGWSRGLDVTSGGSGIVSHAGLVLLRSLADRTGLTAGLSKALATPRLLIHDRGRVLADLATAIAGGAEAISDFAVLDGLREAAGPVGSVPTLADAERDRGRRPAGAGPDHQGRQCGPQAGMGGHRGAPRERGSIGELTAEPVPHAGLTVTGRGTAG
jgi:hypothetical protein